MNLASKILPEMLKLAAEVRKSGINLDQFFILMALEANSGMSPTHIAKTLGFSTAASTGLIDRFEKQGLAVRTYGQNPDDRRRVSVIPTQRGKTVIQKILNLDLLAETPEPVAA